jgi:PAT family beta-lactamase induction signal transducer AmpG
LSDSAAPERRFAAIARGARVYLDRRVAAILLLGFASGLPIMLLGRTLTAWLSEADVDKGTIGLFAFVFAPYAFKYLWAPAIDRLPLPFVTARFGRRRGWILLTQVCLIGAILGLGQADPTLDLGFTALMAFLVAFCSASQDVVIDAYRIEILSEDEQGAGAANVVTGYRIGMWVATAGALFLADRIGWSATYAAMALLVLVGVGTVLLSPEPPAPLRPERKYASATAVRGGFGPLGAIALAIGALSGLLAGSGYGWTAGLVVGVALSAAIAGAGRLFGRASAFREAVLAPFLEFVERNGVKTAAVILAFISLFKASDVLLTLMANPFYLEVGFTKTQIAWVSGTFGFGVTFVGAYLAGMLIYQVGLLRGLFIGGVLMMASNLVFAALAKIGPDYAFFHVAIFIENLSGGMGTTAFVAYLASLCNVRYTAVQYALLTSFMQVLGKFVIVPSSGFLAEGLGWVPFFVLSTVAGIPALLLLVWLSRHEQHWPPTIEPRTVGA